MNSKMPQEETRRDGLFPTNSVHQEATNNAAGEIKVIHYSAVTNVLGKGIVRINCEMIVDKKIVCPKIVAEPCKSYHSC
jgi:hypothetical protein